MLDRDILLVFNLDSLYRLYGDEAWCAISDFGNEILLSGSLFASDDDTVVCRSIHVKYFTHEYGSIKKGDSILIKTTSSSKIGSNKHIRHINCNNEIVLDKIYNARESNRIDLYPTAYDFINDYENKNKVKKKEL